MSKKPRGSASFLSGNTSCAEAYDLIYRILQCGNLRASTINFLREISTLLAGFTRCDVVELRIREREKFFCCTLSRKLRRTFHFEITPSPQDRVGASETPGTSDLEKLCTDLIAFRFREDYPYLSDKGCFWTCQTG
ncbi:MAG: hypothetical protein ACYC9O_12255, partial [Candidatus Latescibacterota bacterium]